MTRTGNWDEWIFCTFRNVNLHVNESHIGLIVSQRQVKYKPTQTPSQAAFSDFS